MKGEFMHAWQQCMTIGILLLIAGCSGGTGSTQNTPTTSATSRVNALPTFSFSQPTEPPQFATVAATLTTNTNSTAEALTLDSEAVERGKGRYEAHCSASHSVKNVNRERETKPSHNLIRNIANDRLRPLSDLHFRGASHGWDYYCRSSRH